MFCHSRAQQADVSFSHLPWTGDRYWIGLGLRGRPEIRTEAALDREKDRRGAARMGTEVGSEGGPRHRFE